MLRGGFRYDAKKADGGWGNGWHAVECHDHLMDKNGDWFVQAILIEEWMRNNGMEWGFEATSCW